MKPTISSLPLRERVREREIHIKTVFLCGGSSKRMFPISEDKFLLDFLGKPLLQHQIEMAQGVGLRDFVIVGNPGNMEKIRRITELFPEIKVEFAVQEEPLGIADALKRAAPFLQGPVLVVNPNDVFSPSAYSRLAQGVLGVNPNDVFSSRAYRKIRSDSDKGSDRDLDKGLDTDSDKDSNLSYMLGYQIKEYFPGGYLEVDSQGDLKHIVEKPNPGEEPSNMVNILLHLHSNPEKVLDYIESAQTTRDDTYECALDNMVKDGHRIKVIPYTDFWAPIKYPWHIFKVMEYFLDSAQPYISPTAHISPTAVIEGKVILGDNVRVLENAVIRGPAYIGLNSVIGNNALVRDYTHIGANSVVGYSTEIKHSYIGDNCWFHSNYIGDSIIDDDCSFGSGAITANFRLDEENICLEVSGSKIDTGYDKLGAIVGKGCRLGINANLMPGVRVGANSFVGPHICLDKDLEANKTVLADTQYRVLDNETKLTQNKRDNLLRSL